jgi:hypothetical protein
MARPSRGRRDRERARPECQRADACPMRAHWDGLGEVLKADETQEVKRAFAPLLAAEAYKLEPDKTFSATVFQRGSESFSELRFSGFWALCQGKG